LLVLKHPAKEDEAVDDRNRELEMTAGAEAAECPTIPPQRPAAPSETSAATDMTRGAGVADTLPVRALRLVAGLFVFSAGLASMVRAGLGLSPWDVFHDSLHSLTPLTFGQVVIAVSLAVLVGSLLLGVRPGIGTVANAVLVGFFTDVILRSPLLGNLHRAPLPPRIAGMLLGVAAIALGTALYIGAGLGAGPRDALMLGIARRSGRSPGGARSAIEALVLVAGVVLGGSAGVGTVVFVVLIGPAINAAFRLFGMQAQPNRRTGHALTRATGTLRNWGRRGQLGSSPTVHASRHTGARV
jgi:uncharacterized membrane protein YczE